MTIKSRSQRRGGTPPSASPPPGPSAAEPFDPTANVIAMLQALGLRQDDLRHESERYLEARLDGLQREVEIRNTCAKELFEAERRRIDEQSLIRSDYAMLLRDAEAKRIDAIRAVDVGAVGVASERATAAANALAAQVSTSAETLRGVVAAAAASATATLQQAVNPILTRLTTLETSANQAAGKQSYADPALVQLVDEVKQMRETSRQNAGKTEGVGVGIGMAVAIGVTSATFISLIIGVLTFILSHH